MKLTLTKEDLAKTVEEVAELGPWTIRSDGDYSIPKLNTTRSLRPLRHNRRKAA